MSNLKRWNPRFFRPWLGIPLGMIVGAVVGYSQILCLTGYCPMTGSWYGGAFMGGAIMFAVFSGDLFSPMKITQHTNNDQEPSQQNTEPPLDQLNASEPMPAERQPES